jgi:predicted signal transduction protein with EAL and GGDEF domain
VFTASYGLAHADESTPFEHVVARADDALYRAKTEGRNRLVVDQRSLVTLQSGNGHRAAEAVAD